MVTLCIVFHKRNKQRNLLFKLTKGKKKQFEIIKIVTSIVIKKLQQTLWEKSKVEVVELSLLIINKFKKAS